MHPANPCGLRIQIRQTVTAPGAVVGVYYRIPQLAAMWHREPGTVMNWLSTLRKSPHAPTRAQVRRVGPNAARRYVEIRDDYAAFIRRVFLDRDIPLPLKNKFGKETNA